MEVMKKSGYMELLGEKNFCRNIDEAVALAREYDKAA